MKRSALYHHHAALGAVFTEHHGWEQVARFSTPQAEAAAIRASTGLADVSYRIKFHTESQPAERWWSLGASRFLVVGDPPLAAPERAVDVTGVYANLLLAGPRARRVLGKLTSLNLSEESLPNRACAQASVAHVHAIVIREDFPGVPAYHILVTRDYAESVWEAIMHAGHEFSITPFGLNALEALRP